MVARSTSPFRASAWASSGSPGPPGLSTRNALTAALRRVVNRSAKPEHSRFRTAERLTNLLAVLCVVGWRVFWLTMLILLGFELDSQVVGN